jgi:hypothetical protein
MKGNSFPHFSYQFVYFNALPPFINNTSYFEQARWKEKELMRMACLALAVRGCIRPAM